MKPRTNLRNPYYYVKSDVIFKISDKKTDMDDSCAQHYVTYVTEKKAVNAGDVYVNLHGDKVKASANGNVDVSTGEIKVGGNDGCDKVFPHFKITDSENNDYYYWLDEFISDGDVVVDGYFKKTVHGDTEGVIDFSTYYLNGVKMKIANGMVKGDKFNKLKSSYPAYLFADAGDEINVNGKVVTVASVTASDSEVSDFPLISESVLEDTVIQLVNEKTIEFANGLLSNIGKEVTEDNLITDENIG